MGDYSYMTRSVCSRMIKFRLENGKVYDIDFIGGCPGNLNAISKLLEGADAQYIVDTLSGNDCAGRGTSCGDQLAIAVAEAMERENEASAS